MHSFSLSNSLKIAINKEGNYNIDWHSIVINEGLVETLLIPNNCLPI